jgi:hypothetical protein
MELITKLSCATLSAMKHQGRWWDREIKLEGQWGPTDAYKYNIGVLLRDSCHPAFPQLQDMQNPTNLIVK